MTEITSLIDDEIIRPVVDRVFPFSSTKDDIAYVEATFLSLTVGSRLVTIQPELARIRKPPIAGMSIAGIIDQGQNCALLERTPTTSDVAFAAGQASSLF